MMEMNKIYQGDCLEIMRKLLNESIDLIYIDPPFFVGKDFIEYSDKWKSSKEFLDYLTIRIKEMWRILKSTGTIYIHCDWHISHYLKIEMDRVFGHNNFRNEIIWYYPFGNHGKKDFGRKHDTIFRYSKTKDYVFNIKDILLPYKSSTLERLKYKGAREKNINKVIKRGGRLPYDVWDFGIVQGNSKESVNYPTQKPEALLDRIIKASSNMKDVVLDPMCGSGTSLIIAKKLGRNWIGIDKSKKAIEITNKRLNNSIVPPSNSPTASSHSFGEFNMGLEVSATPTPKSNPTDLTSPNPNIKEQEKETNKAIRNKIKELEKEK